MPLFNQIKTNAIQHNRIRIQIQYNMNKNYIFVNAFSFNEIHQKIK